MLRVHMVREPDPDYARALTESIQPFATVSFGPQIDAATTVLVEGQLTEEHMAQCPEVRHVVVPFAGLQPKTREVLLKHPHVKAHNLHHNAAMTAEMAMALLLSCARRIVNLHNEFKHDKWEPRYFCRDAASLEGKNVVVLGYGEVGKKVGRACRGFGMHVVGVRTQETNDARAVADLHDILPTADFLVVTLPGTDETDGLIGAEELALLPAHAIVVNVGRGRVIDQQALFDALKEHRIDSAGLDVWWNYPKTPDEPTPPSDLPFSTLPNVVMTPHVGGATRDAEAARMAALASLLKRLARGELGSNQVDLVKGY